MFVSALVLWFGVYMVKDYKKLDVWKLALEQSLDVYEHTKTFPRDEVYGLTAQLRRSSISVLSNIAEGFVRKSSKEFKRFLTIAIGSIQNWKHK